MESFPKNFLELGNISEGFSFRNHLMILFFSERFLGKIPELTREQIPRQLLWIFVETFP